MYILVGYITISTVFWYNGWGDPVGVNSKLK